MIQNEENRKENSILTFLINPLAEARGQVRFCQIIIANFFEKGGSPCTKEFPEVKIRRQLLYHYLKGICNLTQQYGIYTIEISSPKAFYGRYLIQTDDVDIEFSNFFRIHKKIYNIKTHKERTQYSTTMCFHFSIAINLY